MITASSLQRLLACPASAVLPRAENVSEWADAGHDEHERLAVGVGTDDHEYAHLIPRGARSEVKLAFDVASRVGRVIGEGSGRDYGTPGPFEIVGSCDVLGDELDTVVVLDFKTGFADVEPAVTNAQLAFYALAACRALGKSRAVVRILYTQTGRCDQAELSALDLSEFADRLSDLHGRVASMQSAKRTGGISTKEGSWCRYCASKHVCPSKTGLLAQVATGGLAVVGETELTPERARVAYEQLVRIDRLVTEAKKRLDNYVTETGPIDLGDGRFYGRFKRDGKRRIDADKAVDVLRDELGESFAAFESVAFERSTSQAAIERACKSVGGARGLKGRLMRRLEDAGAVERKPEFPIGEYTGPDNAAGSIDMDAINKALESA